MPIKWTMHITRSGVYGITIHNLLPQFDPNMVANFTIKMVKNTRNWVKRCKWDHHYKSPPIIVMSRGMTSDRASPNQYLLQSIIAWSWFTSTGSTKYLGIEIRLSRPTKMSSPQQLPQARHSSSSATFLFHSRTNNWPH